MARGRHEKYEVLKMQNDGIAPSFCLPPWRPSNEESETPHIPHNHCGDKTKLRVLSLSL